MTMKSCQLQCRDDGLLMQRLCLVQYLQPCTTSGKQEVCSLLIPEGQAPEGWSTTVSASVAAACKTAHAGHVQGDFLSGTQQSRAGKQ